MSEDDGGAIRSEISGLRDDFKEFSREVRATLRVVSDPITGYVPRSEIDSRFRELSVSFRFYMTISLAVFTAIVSAYVAFHKG